MIVEQKISRKTQILNIAQQLFREKGFNGTSMRDLATAVGVEPASLYNHFSSKSAILEEICFGLADQFFQAFNGKNACLSPEKQLKLAINGHLMVIVQNLNASVVFLHEWRFLEGEKLSKFILLRQEYEKLFSDIIEEGIKQKVFKEIDVRFYCLTLFSSMNWIYDWYKPNGKYQYNEICDRLYDLILNGIEASENNI